MIDWQKLVNITPFAHQCAAAEATLKKANGFGNFSEQGTGKTLATIMALNAMVDKALVTRALIVCPLSLVWNWQGEIERNSALAWSAHVLEGSTVNRIRKVEAVTKASVRQPQPTVLITNYDSLAKLAPALKLFAPQVVVADEVHAIKNPKSLRSKALKSIPCEYKIGLTGTPIVCSPLDLWSVTNWLRPNVLNKNYYAFRARYCVIYTGAGFPMIKGYRHLDELKAKVDPFTHRVLKSDCLDLPKKLHTRITVDLSPLEAKAYADMARDLIAEIEAEKAPVMADTVLVKLLRLQQITGGTVSDGDRVLELRGSHSKIEALRELMESLEGQRIVVFAKFKTEIAAIKSLCAELERPVYELTGDVSAYDRTKNIVAFQKTDAPSVMVANVQAGGVGVTLTAASHCVYFSNSWSHGDRVQSEDRLHRIGQRNAVTYYDIVARGTVDEYVLDVLEGKRELADKITGDDLKRICFTRES